MVYSDFFDKNQIITISRPGTEICNFIGSHLYCTDISFNTMNSPVFTDSAELIGFYNEIINQLNT